MIFQGKLSIGFLNIFEFRILLDIKYTVVVVRLIFVGLRPTAIVVVVAIAATAATTASISPWLFLLLPLLPTAILCCFDGEHSSTTNNNAIPAVVSKQCSG
jgi:hypothetical protein